MGNCLSKKDDKVTQDQIVIALETNHDLIYELMKWQNAQSALLKSQDERITKLEKLCITLRKDLRAKYDIPN